MFLKPRKVPLTLDFTDLIQAQEPRVSHGILLWNQWSFFFITKVDKLTKRPKLLSQDSQYCDRHKTA
jgi:hypothetical protein